MLTQRCQRGILCGTDEAQEWLLPWWWSRLRDHNDHPVAFCDFGMSSEALHWCRERGEVISLLSGFAVAPKEHVAPEIVQAWEENYSSAVWDLRRVWFKKPVAFLNTPFQKSLWLDLDCEVLGSIDPLFDFCSAESQLGLAREWGTTHHPLFHPQARYNGGVIVFEREAPIIRKWAELALQLTDQFGGDDVLLSHLINTMRSPVEEIPDVYNWRLSQGINLNAVIYHWIREGGKQFIRQFGGVKPAFETFRNNCLSRS